MTTNEQQILKAILLNHLHNVLSPDFFVDSLNSYKQIYKTENMETIRQMVVESINNEVKQLISHIQSIQF